MMAAAPTCLVAAIVAASITAPSWIAPRVSPSTAQEATPLEQVRGLNLPTLSGKIPVYYSEGYDARARSLQAMLTRAAAFYERTLGLDAELVLAVLTADPWKQVRSMPYGLPNVSSLPHVVFLPATADGVVTADALSLKGYMTPATVARLESSGYTYEQAAVRLVDMIGLHELGHTYAVRLGIVPPRPTRWFSEFLATYFAYAYLHAEEPPLATMFYIMAADLALQSPRPRYTSLADFESKYSEVGPKNYSWYQGRFLERVAQVHSVRGISFFNAVQKAFPASDGDTLPVNVVLRRLERISPGFLAWSADMR
jgi:hypothetical protein